MPQHGPHARTNGATSSTRTYDHTGAVISRVTTGPRRNIYSSSAEIQPTAVQGFNTSRTEIDNHADTHCFGSNFVPYGWTDMVCTVSPFLSEYKAVENVRVCSGATAVTLDNGEVIVLIFGQGLWFGDKLEHSLINPNQCRAYGIGVCDDPTDPHREMGFHHQDQFVPIEMDGTIAGFTSRSPTRRELDE